MTSASVKDLNSLMTFISTPGTGKSAQSKGSMEFGALMSRSGNDSETNIGTSKGISTKMEAEDAKADLSVNRKVDVKEKASKTTSEAEPTDVSPEDTQKMLDAANEVVKEVAKELDVTEDAVKEAMEALGLELISLLDPTNLNSLVLEITGEEPISLVTNENLFNTVKNLSSMVDATIADLADDMDIEISDVISKVEQAEVQLSNTPETQMSVEANSDYDKTAEFMVNIHTETKEVKAVTDEKGNVISTQTVEISDETTTMNEVAPKSETKHEFKHESTENNGSQLMGQGNNLLNNLTNSTQEATTDMAPQQSFFSNETQDIMNQIMDNIKVNVKPDVQELEMQLHPESLGTVKINLVNHAGEITAEFKVASENVKEAVETQIVELKQALKDSGVKVEAVSVSVDTSGFDSNLWQGKGNDDNFEQDDRNKRPHRINLNELDALFEDEASEEEILAAQMMEVNGNTVDYQA